MTALATYGYQLIGSWFDNPNYKQVSTKLLFLLGSVRQYFFREADVCGSTMFRSSFPIFPHFPLDNFARSCEIKYAIVTEG